MALTRIPTKGIADSAVNECKVAPGSVTSAKIGPGAVTAPNVGPNAIVTGNITDGTIVNADISPTAAIASSKLVVDTGVLEQNISLLGFKMAVNEGLTVFNLVDGVVDEFHDESGTDEAEGSNDTYCASGDLYQNVGSPVPISAGFSLTAVTEPTTSAAGTNPAQGAGTYGAFTVPNGMTSASLAVWGAGGGAGGYNPSGYNDGGGGGLVTGTLAVTPSQVLEVAVGEGGLGGGPGSSQIIASFGGRSNPNGYPSPGSPFGFINGCQGGGGSYESLFGGLGGGVGAIGTSATIGFSNGAPAVPGIAVIAGAGGGGGDPTGGGGGAGGGLTGCAGGTTSEQTNANGQSGGGGDQEQGGQGGPSGGQDTNGGLFYGGMGQYSSAGGGYYGGGGMGYPSGHTSNGGGSSYYGHPQITSGATEEGSGQESGGQSNPLYVADTSEGGSVPQSPVDPGEDGYALITGSAAGSTVSSTIVSTAFAAGSVPTTSRIVVFQENVDSPTLNTDIIASISRDGGSNFTTATLSDSGYVTGSSGQRILTGQATISGQPSGQSMRWKLALANNQVKIHGVSLQWN